MPFIIIDLFEAHEVRAFVGGCHLRGDGSKFRAKAHAHYESRTICFRSDKWLGCQELLIHELAHITSNVRGHIDRWRNEVLRLGGTIKEVPGILKSYEKKRRNK